MTQSKKIGDQLKAQATQEVKKQLRKATQKGGALSHLDQNGDGKLDSQDALKFGMGFLMKKFLGKK